MLMKSHCSVLHTWNRRKLVRIYAFAAIASTSVLSSCSPAHMPRLCAEKQPISAAGLIQSAADRYVAQRSGKWTENEIAYRSGRDLIKKNPICCYMSRRPSINNDYSVPIEPMVSVIIIFKRYTEGEKEYYLYRTDIEGCRSDFDDGGLALSETDMKARQNDRTLWRAR